MGSIYLGHSWGRKHDINKKQNLSNHPEIFWLLINMPLRLMHIPSMEYYPHLNLSSTIIHCPFWVTPDQLASWLLDPTDRSTGDHPAISTYHALSLVIYSCSYTPSNNVINGKIKSCVLLINGFNQFHHRWYRSSSCYLLIGNILLMIHRLFHPTRAMIEFVWFVQGHFI